MGCPRSEWVWDVGPGWRILGRACSYRQQCAAGPRRCGCVSSSEDGGSCVGGLEGSQSQRGKVRQLTANPMPVRRDGAFPRPRPVLAAAQEGGIHSGGCGDSSRGVAPSHCQHIWAACLLLGSVNQQLISCSLGSTSRASQLPLVRASVPPLHLVDILFPLARPLTMTIAAGWHDITTVLFDSHMQMARDPVCNSMRRVYSRDRFLRHISAFHP